MPLTCSGCVCSVNIIDIFSVAIKSGPAKILIRPVVVVLAASSSFLIEKRNIERCQLSVHLKERRLGLNTTPLHSGTIVIFVADSKGCSSGEERLVGISSSS